MLITRRKRALAQRYLSVQARLQASMERVLDRFFREQAARVVRRFIAQERMTLKATAEEIFPDEELARLRAVLAPLLGQAWLDAADFSQGLVGGFPIEVVDPRVQMLLQEAANRVVGIHAETRQAIREVLADGVERGYSDWQIANGVPKDDWRGLRAVVQETYRNRAQTIARTEVALASNAASADQYEAAFVSEVDIIDGPSCGWRRHSDSDKANGTRRTLVAFRQHPISHPNCRRVPLPVLA